MEVFRQTGHWGIISDIEKGTILHAVHSDMYRSCGGTSCVATVKLDYVN
jgi:hypothetical protein